MALIKEFTTFEVGKICGVFHTTVINWVNKGKLKARVTPGGHRRIALPELVEFMHRYDMPVPEDLTRRAKRVLVVEDDPAVQRLLRRTLQSIADVEVSACAGGVEALMAIGKEAPDLLILDLRIPQVSGVEVCRVLKSSDQTRPIRIIAITGEPLAAESEEFLRGHVDGFFQKPLPMPEIKARVRELLDLEVEPVSTR